ncbi:MAG: hypothetical protein Q9163_001169 [Psora crenata]
MRILLLWAFSAICLTDMFSVHATPVSNPRAYGTSPIDGPRKPLRPVSASTARTEPIYVGPALQLSTNITKPKIDRTLALQETLEARPIGDSAFMSLMAQAFSETDTFVNRYGRDTTADFTTWMTRHSGLSLLLCRETEWPEAFTYGLLWDAARLLKWQLPYSGYCESNITVYDINILEETPTSTAMGSIVIVGPGTKADRVGGSWCDGNNELKQQAPRS